MFHVYIVRKPDDKYIVRLVNSVVSSTGIKTSCTLDESKIGMTAEMCREAWGTPDDINRSSGSWGVHEQWCYDWGGYLYMENGKLTSIQN